MAQQLPTYSGNDTNFALNFPLTGIIQAAGISKSGLNQATVRMSTVRTDKKIGMDGAVIISAVPGNDGEIELQVWQTSPLHEQLLAAYNALSAAFDAGDVTEWASGTAFVQNVVDGSQHTATGVCFQKVPDKQYQATAQIVTWVLVCANIVSQ